MATPPPPEPRLARLPPQPLEAAPTRAGDADSPTPPFAGGRDPSHPSEAPTSFLMAQPADQTGPPQTPASRAATSGTPEVIEALVSYRLGREIGRGGMGTVLKGRDTRLGREVA